MKKFFKILGYAILVVFILFQFYPRPSKNRAPGISSRDISRVHQVPANVQQVLSASCYDCHSNNTRYPWYAPIQPVALWLGNHIDEAKKELNFSEFGDYTLRRQYRKLEEINSEIEEDKMPLPSYTFIHRSTRLNEADKLLLMSWADNLRDSFKINYPADSLSKKK